MAFSRTEGTRSVQARLAVLTMIDCEFSRSTSVGHTPFSNRSGSTSQTSSPRLRCAEEPQTLAMLMRDQCEWSGHTSRSVPTPR